MTGRVIGLQVATLAVTWWLVGLSRRNLLPFSSSSVDDYLALAGIAVCVAGLASVVAFTLSRRPVAAHVALMVQALGLMVLVGAARFPTIPDWATVIVDGSWLGAAAIGAALVFVASIDDDRRLWGRPACVLAAVLVTGVGAAVLDRGTGLRSTLGPLAPTAVPPAALVWLGLHTAVLFAGGLWLLSGGRSRQGPARLPLRHRSVTVVGALWLFAVVAERLIALLPTDSFRDVARGHYRPWAFLIGGKVPLLAYGALVVVVGWSVLVQPARRAPGGRLQLRNLDPVAILRNDMADWLGDPTLEIAFADGSGGWVAQSGEVRIDSARYDRRVTVLTRDARAVAALVHDVALLRSPEALATAAALAGLALDANQLVVESEARLSLAHQLSGRLLVADDLTRSEVLDELESGPLARLRRSIDAIELGAPLSDLLSELRLAASEVRQLSHGVYPVELADGGLWSALPDVAGVPRRRFPSSVELTAYLLAQDTGSFSLEDLGGVLRIRRAIDDLRPGIVDRLTVLGASIGDGFIDLPLDDDLMEW